MTHPIVGIGELLWDVYPDGRKVAGGAPFNFAFHCHQLGHPAVIVSRVGNDDLGRELRERVRELGLSDEYIQTDDEHPTGTVQVTLDANAVPTYTITENVAWDHIAWDEKLQKLAESAAAVCFGTLAQRANRSQETIEMFVGAVAPGLRVFDVNFRRTPDLDIRRVNALVGSARTGEPGVVDWFKVNETEFEMLMDELTATTNIDWEPGRKESWLRYLFDTGTDIRKVGILTRGTRSTAVHNWQRTEWIPAVPAAVVDTVGAGDSFTAAMVCLHLEERPLRECAKFAVHYAARVCEQPGGTPRIDRKEVERAAFGVK